MRLLHTSDWHVGRTIQGRSRADEFEAVLDELVRIATAERVDAVLVSGDLFDHRVAHADAERLIFETLARLVVERIHIVAIPGNHDPADRWDAFRPLLEPLGVHVVPFVRPPDEGSVVEISSRDGTERLVAACVPFVPERKLGSAAALFAGSEHWSMAYAQGVGDLFEAMSRAFRPDAVNVLMAHCFATDVQLGGGENELTVTLDYAVPPARFPGTATYIALGHVHKPQAIGGSPAPARYAGSLLQLDFGEREQRKSVTLVEAAPGKPARIRVVPLTAGRQLIDVAGTLDELRAQAATFGDAWLRVTVRTDGPVPGIADEVRQILPSAVIVRSEHPRLEDAEPTEPVAGLAPREQFVRYYRAKHAAETPAGILAAFDEVRTAVSQ